MTKNIVETDISSWYELAFKSPNIFLIKIHQEALKALKKIIKSNSPIIKDLSEKFSNIYGFNSFIGPSETQSWGFGKILIPAKSADNDWLTYECLLPVLHNGSRFIETKSNVLAVRSTFQVLFSALLIFDNNTNSKDSQLMVIDSLRVDADIYGGALNVTLTPTVAKWLSKQSDNFRLTDVEKAMFQAHNHMWRDEEFQEKPWDFIAICRQPKWINFTVPGNACGLDPNDYHDSEKLDLGYRLSPHNTDSSLQQLTLLIGLAKLQELIRSVK